MKARASNLDGEANKLAWFINGLGDYTSDNGVGKWTDPYSHSIESVVYSFSDVSEELQAEIDWSYILYQVPGNLEPDELYEILDKRNTESHKEFL
jgi:hypothetical protein